MFSARGQGRRGNRATLSCRPRLSKPTKVKALPPRPFTMGGGETCIRKKEGRRNPRDRVIPFEGMHLIFFRLSTHPIHRQGDGLNEEVDDPPTLFFISHRSWWTTVVQLSPLLSLCLFMNNTLERSEVEFSRVEISLWKRGLLNGR